MWNAFTFTIDTISILWNAFTCTIDTIIMTVLSKIKVCLKLVILSSEMNNSNKGYRVVFSGILEAQLPDAAKWHNFHVFREGDVSNSWSLYSLAPLWT